MESFKKFENDLDNKINSLDILNVPLRAILTFVNLFISHCCSKERINADDDNSCDCSSISSTLSYIIPLTSKCDPLTMGANASDILSTIKISKEDELSILLKYARFCEFAPFVWRKIYDYSITYNNLTLNYKNNYFESEKKDIILTALSSSFSITLDNINPLEYDEEVVNYTLKEEFNIIFCKNELIKYKTWYKKHWYDNQITPDGVYPTLGVSKNDYIEFQTFWYAFANYYIEISQALIRYMREKNDFSEFVQNELLEHTSPCLKKKEFFNIFKDIIGLNWDVFEIIMNIFSINPSDNYMYGDGYFPVFHEINDCYLFSPYTIRSLLSPRNMLYCILKTNQEKFDNQISPLLEPHLIAHCVRILEKLPNIEIKENKNWKNGEFDILAYFSNDNLVIHFQAKASMPPEGARMTLRLESRMLEGIDQLRKFKKLNKREQEEVLSETFGKTIDNVIVIDALIGWGGFGTKKVWDSIYANNIAALNPSVLSNYVKRYSNKTNNIRDFVSDINQIESEIINETSPYLEEDKYSIGDFTITYPALRYDNTKLVKYKEFII